MSDYSPDSSPDYSPSNPPSPYFLRGADFDLLGLSGADATRFLQGQLTCDVQKLQANACTPGAALTNKGRAYALFWLLKLEAESYLFVLNKGLGAVLLGQLRKYLPFYKCQFNEAPGGELLLFIGSRPNSGAPAFTLGDSPFATLLWLPQGAESSTLTSHLEHAPVERWLGDAMLLGHFPFTPEDAELYTAQELRLDQHGYVSYEKGCYTGQEIVARMHYRGKAKKQLCRLELEALEDPKALTLRDAAGQELGHLLKALPLGASRWRALAFLPSDMLDMGQFPAPSAGRLLACAPL
ncbi:MAG: hypothetical protein LBE21_09920 [Pseudomonadales bacterium]|nr:hypothetical protein [Pseudomonadales bacterium]